MVLYWSPAMISCRDRGVVAGHGRHGIDAGRLERGDGAAAGAVIGGDDAEDLGREAGNLAARPLLRLRRRPFRRVVFGQDRIAALVEAFMDALLDQAGGRVCRRAVDLQQAAAGGVDLLRLQMLDKRIRDGLADAFIVEGDVEIGGRGRNRAVIGDDLDALALRQLDQRGGGGRVDGIEHDRLGALRDHRIELLLLARGVGIGILVEHLAARAELLHLGGKAGIIVLLVAGRGLVGHQERDRGVGDGGGMGGAGKERKGERCRTGRLPGKCGHSSNLRLKKMVSRKPERRMARQALTARRTVARTMTRCIRMIVLDHHSARTRILLILLDFRTSDLQHGAPPTHPRHALQIVFGLLPVLPFRRRCPRLCSPARP